MNAEMVAALRELLGRPESRDAIAHALEVRQRCDHPGWETCEPWWQADAAMAAVLELAHAGVSAGLFGTLPPVEFPAKAWGSAHARQGRPIGVYGDHPEDDHDYRRPDGTRRGSKALTLDHAREVMGMPWASWHGCVEAIPPAFTEFLGEQLVAHLSQAVTP